MKNSNVGATHTGAFREWKEDFETVEIFLPLPPATCKRELVCVITPDSLNIRHTRHASLLVRPATRGPGDPRRVNVVAGGWRAQPRPRQAVARRNQE